MNRFARTVILMIGLGTCSVTLAFPQENSLVFLWSPRQTDVGPPNSTDNEVLETILKLCRTKKYSPKDTEGIDFIIRKNFLVSAKFVYAYRLYINRINELNPDHAQNPTVKKGEEIVLPIGPKFGGSDLSDRVLSSEVRAAALMSLSQSAYQVHQDVPNHVKRHAIDTLKYYVSPTGNGSDDKLWEAIKARGLVYALPKNSPKRKAAQQVSPIEVTATDESGNQRLKALKKQAPDKILPGMFPVSTSQSASCQQECISCRAALNVPQSADFSKVKVLVIDTGVQAGLVNQDHIVKQTESDDGMDASPQFHGTFVYSEIAAGQVGANSPKLFGPIPQDNVFVSKAVRNLGGTEYFVTTDIINAWNNFNLTIDKNYPSDAYTRIVNISAFGEPVLDLLHPPTVPYGSQLLLVAAAGNDPSGGTQAAPAANAFPRLSGGSTPLIIVGAQDNSGKAAFYSNWNPQYVQLFAPGDCVCGAPGKINGTSQAAPFVTVAAAAVAAAHPDWNPLWVMWRLLSTADHPDPLKGKALAGTVNLARALSAPIYLTETLANGTTKVHTASSIAYDQTWKDAFRNSNSNVHNKETLRLYDPAVNPATGTVCFSMFTFLYYPAQSFCVAATAKIEITEDGGSVPLSLSASQINDLILPMPDPNGDGSNLPNVSIAHP